MYLTPELQLGRSMKALSIVSLNKQVLCYVLAALAAQD